MLQPKNKDWLTGYKNKAYIYSAYKRLTFRSRDTYWMKVRGWLKILHINRNKKKAGVAILISEKNRF